MGILLKVFADRAEVVLTIVCSLYRLLQYISCYLAQGEAQRKEWTKYVRETVKNGAPKAMPNSSKFLSTSWRSGKGFTGSGGGLIKKIRNGTKKKWYLYKVLAYGGWSLWPGVGKGRISLCTGSYSSSSWIPYHQ